MNIVGRVSTEPREITPYISEFEFIPLNPTLNDSLFLYKVLMFDPEEFFKASQPMMQDEVQNLLAGCNSMT